MTTLRRWSHRHEQAYLFLVWSAVMVAVLVMALVAEWLR